MTYQDRSGNTHELFEDPVKGPYYIKYYSTESIRANPDKSGNLISAPRSKPVRVYVKTTKVGRPKHTLTQDCISQIMFLREIMSPSDIANQLKLSRHVVLRYLQHIQQMEEQDDAIHPESSESESQ